MALDLTQLSELDSFLGNYEEEFKKAEVRKSPVDLPPGIYTCRIDKVFLDKLPDGSKYMLKWDFIVLTAEPQNIDQIDNLTQRVNWININDSSKLVDNLQRLKQAFYDVGYLLQSLKPVLDPAGALLRGLKGMVVQINVQHNQDKENPAKVYVNMYINKVLSKPSAEEIANNQSEEEKIPF